MSFGFIRVGTVSPKCKVADCTYNVEQILNEMDNAAKQSVSLLAFPELCVTGYTCSDLFLQQTLLQGATDALKKIAQKSEGLPMLILVGAPLVWRQKLYNCAVAICGGKILGIVPKQNLPNYAEFYEARQFTPGTIENSTIELNGQMVPFGTKLLFCCKEEERFVVGVEICEDLWVAQPPSCELALAGATVLANLSASNETIGKAQYRRMLVSAQSARLLCAYLYADAGEGESTTDMVFSGHSIIAENGVLLAQSELFTCGLTVADVDVERLCQERRKTTTFQSKGEDGYVRIEFSAKPSLAHFSRDIPRLPFVPDNPVTRQERCKSILQMQTVALCKRIVHTGCKKLVIAVSGGLDSTLALLVCVHAMDRLGRPREDVLAITMPCFGTTKRTRSNAELLCRGLGLSFQTIDITASVRSHFRDIGQNEDVFDVTFENAQARERTQVLMDLANKTGGLVIGTGDLSELALGFATYNGDHISMYGVNASIPKTLVRHLVAYEAEQNKAVGQILLDILATPVSPELLPPDKDEIAQKTEEIVGPYDLHDFFLFNFVRFGFTPQKILFLAQKAFAGVYDGPTIRKWLTMFLRRFFAQQFKRSCLPDGPKVGSVALSPRGDWRMPSDASWALWQSDLTE